MPEQVFVFSSRNFDGASPLVTPLIPSRDANQPRCSATQAALGRISFYVLARSGENRAVFRARCWGSAGTLQVRSVNGVEIAQLPAPARDQPAPAALDQLLYTVALTTAWSAPLILGPTDALALLEQQAGTMGTVEILISTGDEMCCDCRSARVTRTRSL